MVIKVQLLGVAPPLHSNLILAQYLFLILGPECNRICNNSITISLNNKLRVDMLTPTRGSDMASTCLAGF